MDINWSLFIKYSVVKLFVVNIYCLRQVHHVNRPGSPFLIVHYIKSNCTIAILLLIKREQSYRVNHTYTCPYMYACSYPHTHTLNYNIHYLFSYLYFHLFYRQSSKLIHHLFWVAIGMIQVRGCEPTNSINNNWLPFTHGSWKEGLRTMASSSSAFGSAIL